MLNNTAVLLTCGSPGYKSNFIPLRGLNVLLRLKHYSTELPLRAGLICAEEDMSAIRVSMQRM